MQRILWFSFLLCTACYITGPIVDPDLWWHITAGKWILSHGTVPHIDYWNLFGHGAPWRAYSWSNEIVYALADRLYGVYGLLTIKHILAAAIVFSFGITWSRLSADWFVGALLAAIGAGACVSHFTLRPQSLVWALFVWAIYEAHLVYEQGLSRERIVRTVLIFILWANTHVTTVLGIATIFAFAYHPARRGQAIKLAAIAFAATLVTPYFGGEWIAFWSQASHPLDMRSIAEFKPATIMQYPTSFLILGVALYAALAYLSKRRPEPIRMLGLGAAAIAGLAVIKFLPLAAILALSLVAIEWRTAKVNKELPLVQSIEVLRRFSLEKIPPEGLSFLLLSLTCVFVWNLFQGPISNRVIPVAAVDFIEKHALPFPILNDFGRGGYLIYRFSTANGEPRDPSVLVPIDGRTNVMTKEAWRKHEAALFGKENWKSYFDLVKPETVLWPNESPLLAILEAQAEWCRVFKNGDKDDGFSVFVKRALYEARKSELPSDTCGKPEVSIKNSELPSKPKELEE